MAIIKAPPKQPKSVTVQARAEESVKEQLDLYARFIDSTPPYVITEALKVLFKRDDELQSLARPTAQRRKDSRTQGRRTQRDRVTQMKDPPTQFEMRENTASSRRHASRLTLALPLPREADVAALRPHNESADTQICKEKPSPVQTEPFVSAAQAAQFLSVKRRKTVQGLLHHRKTDDA